MSPEERLAQLQRESKSSVELQRAKDGTYYWTIKVYFEEGEGPAALAAIHGIDGLLRANYLPKAGE